MKYLDEYRNPQSIVKLQKAIAASVTKPWKIMEICGGQTHTIIKYGIDKLLPEQITLVHGPGCPVCVTPQETIDKAVHLSLLPDIIFCSFGDMLRVPGSQGDLLSAKSQGADIRVVYSPLAALEIARNNPDKKVIFFSIGFETTVPADAMAIYMAKQKHIKNFFCLVSHVLVPPAMEAILSNPDCRINAFLAAGHVCTVMGFTQYEPISAKYKVPIVVTGFEPIDIMRGILLCVNQLENKCYKVENEYSRIVNREGNFKAKKMIREVFQITSQKWRGIGNIAQSGLKLQAKYKQFDANIVFHLEDIMVKENKLCIAGKILQGIKKPNQCPAFAKKCNPQHPLGAPMVSREGACLAYYQYKANCKR
jgi:hydrogenase expression/formation protein HypD